MNTPISQLILDTKDTKTTNHDAERMRDDSLDSWKKNRSEPSKKGGRGKLTDHLHHNVDLGLAADVREVVDLAGIDAGVRRLHVRDADRGVLVLARGDGHLDAALVGLRHHVLPGLVVIDLEADRPQWYFIFRLFFYVFVFFIPLLSCTYSCGCNAIKYNKLFGTSFVQSFTPSIR